MHPKAMLANPDDVSVIYLIAYEPKHYFQNVVASAGPGGMTRQVALQRMLRPFSRAVRAMQG